MQTKIQFSEKIVYLKTILYSPDISYDTYVIKHFSDEWRFQSDPAVVNRLNRLIEKYEKVSGRSFADTDAKIDLLKQKDAWLKGKGEVSNYLNEERNIIIKQGTRIGFADKNFQLFQKFCLIAIYKYF